MTQISGQVCNFRNFKTAGTPENPNWCERSTGRE